jgi:hypothetical protein
MAIPTALIEIIMDYKHQIELGTHMEQWKYVNQQFKSHQGCLGWNVNQLWGDGESAFEFNWRFQGSKVVMHIVNDIERHTVMWDIVKHKWFKNM